MNFCLFNEPQFAPKLIFGDDIFHELVQWKSIYTYISMQKLSYNFQFPHRSYLKKKKLVITDKVDFLVRACK